MHESVARAIMLGSCGSAHADDMPLRNENQCAAAAIRVVLAEARRSIEALDWHISGSGPPGECDAILIERDAVLAVLALLAEPLSAPSRRSAR